MFNEQKVRKFFRVFTFIYNDVMTEKVYQQYS